MRKEYSGRWEEIKGEKNGRRGEKRKGMTTECII
jgi:hypothetical protein